MTQWIVTDPDSMQIRRKYDAGIFELFQIQLISDEDEPRYAIAHAAVYTKYIDNEEADDIVRSYGYDSLSELREECGDETDEILAECKFELDSQAFSNLMPRKKAEGYTWEEAQRMIIGLSGYGREEECGG
ncbi:MAG: hypothetical protein LUE86_08775 [Clostridiales bacterium]|nr:hypothetical protein [Clostridiales bacterium]